MSYFINTEPITVGEGGTGLESTGTVGQVLTTVSEGVTGWLDPATNGTVTSVAATVPSFLSLAGSPITSSGTLAITLSGTALPVTSGGTGLIAGGATNQVLTTTAPNVYGWTTPTTGTVTSIGITPPSFLSASADITTSGDVTLSYNGTSLPVTSGGTGLIAGGATNQVLTTTAPNVYGWTTPTTGTVTSVGISTLSAPFLSAGSAVTSSGSVALSLSGTALPFSSGGTGLTVGGAVGTFLQGTGTGSAPAWQVLNDTTTTGGAYIGGGAIKGFPSVSGTQIGRFDADTELVLMLSAVDSVVEIGAVSVPAEVFRIQAGTAAVYSLGNTTTLATKKIQFENEITLPATKPLLPVHGGTGLNAPGTNTHVLTMVAGSPAWAAPATSGTVTSVAATVPSFLSIAGSPITSSGTLAITYNPLGSFAGGAYFGGGANKSFADNVAGTQIGTFSTTPSQVELVRVLGGDAAVLEMGTTTDFANRILISKNVADTFWSVGNSSNTATHKIQFENEITLPATKPLLAAYGGTGITTSGTSGQLLNHNGTTAQWGNTISTLITTGISKSLSLGVSGTFEANFGNFDPSGVPFFTKCQWTIDWHLIGNMCHCYMYGVGFGSVGAGGQATTQAVAAAAASPAYQNAICLPFNSMPLVAPSTGIRVYLGTNFTWTGATAPLEGSMGGDVRFMDFIQPNGTEPGLPVLGDLRNCGGVTFIYKISDLINPTTVTIATNTGVFI